MATLWKKTERRDRGGVGGFADSKAGFLPLSSGGRGKKLDGLSSASVSETVLLAVSAFQDHLPRPENQPGNKNDGGHPAQQGTG